MPSVDYNSIDAVNEEMLHAGKKALDTMATENGQLSDSEEGSETEKLDKVFQVPMLNGSDEQHRSGQEQNLTVLLRTLQHKVNGIAREINIVKKQAAREERAHTTFGRGRGPVKLSML